jgi:hypothetical protein
MSAIKQLNPNAEVARAAQALQLNIGAATGLQSVLKSNLGPKGALVFPPSLHVPQRAFSLCGTR